MDSPVAPPVSASVPARPVRRLGPVLWALVFATLVCYGMLAVRMFLGESLILGGLYFNLLLAWIPLGLSLVLRESGLFGARRHLFWLAGVLWVLFYPNSFYIVTDLIHIKKFGATHVPKWLDMMITAAFAFAGVFLGCAALYLLHLIVRERFGYRTGWVFAVVMLALASFGIYVGRFLRWNSWEAFTRPWKLAGQVGLLAQDWKSVAAFSVTFFFFSLMSYLFLVAFARLHDTNV